MPQVPSLDPAMAQAQTEAKGGPSPAQFLMAAADLHQQGQLSAPVPEGKSLPVLSKRSSKKLRVIK